MLSKKSKREAGEVDAEEKNGSKRKTVRKRQQGRKAGGLVLSKERRTEDGETGAEEGRR